MWLINDTSSFFLYPAYAPSSCTFSLSSYFVLVIVVYSLVCASLYVLQRALILPVFSRLVGGIRPSSHAQFHSIPRIHIHGRIHEHLYPLDLVYALTIPFLTLYAMTTHDTALASHPVFGHSCLADTALLAAIPALLLSALSALSPRSSFSLLSSVLPLFTVGAVAIAYAWDVGKWVVCAALLGEADIAIHILAVLALSLLSPSAGARPRAGAGAGAGGRGVWRWAAMVVVWSVRLASFVMLRVVPFSAALFRATGILSFSDSSSSDHDSHSDSRLWEFEATVRESVPGWMVSVMVIAVAVHLAQGVHVAAHWIQCFPRLSTAAISRKKRL
eukprot:ANDGO_07364.mRNA.1 hypothetical protein